MTDSLVIVWVLAFVATNLDDIVLLIVFFSHPSFRPRNIVIGEVSGIGSLLAISIVGAAGVAAVPREWIGLLGCLPLLIGLRLLLANRTAESASETPDVDEPARSWLGTTELPLPSDLLVVWGVTIAHGADNLSLYVPLLRAQGFEPLPLIVAVFTVMTAVWCLLGYLAAEHRAVGRFVGRYSRLLLPYILVGLGLFVLFDNDTLTLVTGALA